jgi:hypothetical protein
VGPYRCLGHRRHYLHHHRHHPHHHPPIFSGSCPHVASSSQVAFPNFVFGGGVCPAQPTLLGRAAATASDGANRGRSIPPRNQKQNIKYSNQQRPILFEKYAHFIILIQHPASTSSKRETINVVLHCIRIITHQACAGHPSLTPSPA